MVAYETRVGRGRQVRGRADGESRRLAEALERAVVGKEPRNLGSAKNVRRTQEQGGSSGDLRLP